MATCRGTVERFNVLWGPWMDYVANPGQVSSSRDLALLALAEPSLRSRIDNINIVTRKPSPSLWLLWSGPDPGGTCPVRNQRLNLRSQVCPNLSPPYPLPHLFLSECYLFFVCLFFWFACFPFSSRCLRKTMGRPGWSGEPGGVVGG